MLKLIIEDAENRRTTVPLLRAEITIGRREGNTIRLTERNVSRDHARIFKKGDDYYLEDRSRYGTRGGDGRITSKRIEPGDAFVIGDYRLSIREDRPSVPSPVVPVREIEDDWPDVPAAAVTAPPSKLVAPSLAQVDFAPRSADAPQATEAPLAETVPLAVPRPAPAAAEPGATAEAAPTTARTLLRAAGAAFDGGTLVGQTAPYVGSVLTLDRTEIVLGSGDHCDVQIEHPGVASSHVRLSHGKDGWVLEDLGGGVSIDGSRVDRRAFTNGALLRFGGLAFRYTAPGGKVVLRPPTGAAPAVSFEDDEPPVRSGGRAGLVVGIGAVIVIAGVAFLLVGRDKPTPPVAAPASEPPPAAAPSAPAAPDARESLAAARAALDAGDWERAATALEAIRPGDPAAAEAGPLREALASEKAAASSLAAARAAQQSGRLAEALEALRGLPQGSRAARTAESEQLAGTWRDALISGALAEADAAIAAGNAPAARASLERASGIAPDPRLSEKLASLASPAPAAPPEPPPPAPEARRAPERPAPARPARTAAAPDSARPTPAPRAPSPTPAAAAPPTPAPAAPVPAPTTSQELRNQAARAGVQQNYREAIQLLERARALDPNDAQVNLMLFSNYRAIGAASRASQAITRYLRQRPSDPRRAEYEAWLAQNPAP